MRLIPAPFRRGLASAVHSIAPNHIDRAYRALLPLVPANKRLSSVGDKVHKLLAFLPLSNPEAIYAHALSHWPPSPGVVLCSQPPDLVAELMASSSWLPSLEEQMMLCDTVQYLPDDILTKVDRASMAVSLEARVPILDHRVVEFAWSLPMNFKTRNRSSKWALRQVLYKYVPAKLVDRPKMGFGVPIDSWLRGPLREWAEDLLSLETLKQQGYFDYNAVRLKWQEHISGARNWQYLLWDVLVFEDWICQSDKRRLDNIFEASRPTSDVS